MGTVGTADDRLLSRYWLRTVRIGCQTTILVVLVLGPFVLFGERDVPTIPFFALTTAAVLGALVTYRLPWKRLFESGLGLPLLYAWSLADIAVVTAFIWTTGPTNAHTFFLYVFTTLFFAASYPRRGQVVLFVFTTAAYLTMWGLTDHSQPVSEALFRIAALAIVAFMASFLARELMEQMAEHKLARSEADRRASLIARVAAAARNMSVLGPAAVLQAVVDATETLGFDAAAIFLLDEDSVTYDVTHSRGLPESFTSCRHDASVGLVGMVRDARQTLTLNDYSSLSDGDPDLKRLGFKAVIGATIPVRGRTAAILVAGTRTERRLTPEDLEAFDLLASQASRALQLAKDFEELQQAQEELKVSRAALHEWALASEKTASLLQATLESTADGLLVVDNSGRIVAYNEKFAGMWRMPSEVLASGDEARAISVVLDQLKDPDTFVRKIQALNVSDAESFDVLEFKDGRTFERYSQPQRLGRTMGEIVGRVWSFRDVTERRAAEKALADAHLAVTRADHEKRRLLTHLVNAKEEERKRVASDIHDDTIQIMTSVVIGLERLARKTDDPDHRETVMRLENSARGAIARLRTMVFELRPPALDLEGLIAALGLYLEEFRRDTGILYALNNELEDEPPLAHRTVLYRIVQEALTNVRKHARASQVIVTLKQEEGGIRLQVVDNGVGLAPRAPTNGGGRHIGVTEMRERAEIVGGRFDIRSRPNGGTAVEVWLPPSDDDLPAEESRFGVV